MMKKLWSILLATLLLALLTTAAVAECEHDFTPDFHNGEVCASCHTDSDGLHDWENGLCTLCEKLNEEQNPEPPQEPVCKHEDASVVSYEYVDEEEHQCIYMCTCGETWGKREAHIFYAPFHNGDVCMRCDHTKDGNDHSNYNQSLDHYEYVDETKHLRVYVCTCGDTWEGYGRWEHEILAPSVHDFHDDYHNGNVCFICNYTKDGEDHSEEYVYADWHYEYVDAAQHKRVSICTCGEECVVVSEHSFSDDKHNGDLCNECKYTKEGENHSDYSVTTHYEYVNTKEHKAVCVCSCGDEWESQSAHLFLMNYHVCYDCKYTKDGRDHSNIDSYAEHYVKYVNARHHTYAYICACGDEWEYGPLGHTYDIEFHNGDVCQTCNYTRGGEDHSGYSYTSAYEYVDATKHKIIWTCTCGDQQEIQVVHSFYNYIHNGSVCQECNYRKDGKDHSDDREYVDHYEYVNATEHKSVYVCTCGETWEGGRSAHSFSDNYHNGNVCGTCHYTKDGTDHSGYSETNEWKYVNASEHKLVSVCTCGDTWEYIFRMPHLFENDWHNGDVCERCHTDSLGLHDWENGVCTLCEKLNEEQNPEPPQEPVCEHDNMSGSYQYLNENQHTYTSVCPDCGYTDGYTEPHYYYSGWLNGTVCAGCKAEKPTTDPTPTPTPMPSPVTDGLNVDDGYYYVDGEKALDYNGLVEYDGAQFLVENGKLNTNANGLKLTEDAFYYLAGGQVQEHHGFAEYDGEWFYLDGGKLDTTATGVFEYDGALFLVAAGRLVSEYSGLAQVPSGEWYYVAAGRVLTEFTGPVEYNGAVFQVVNGRLVA